MKSRIMLLALVALSLGGCATYSGGTSDESGTISGYDSNYQLIPVYRTGSPNGHEMGASRPDLYLYR